METIEIFRSLKKAVLLLLGCLAFVAIGIWIVINPEEMAARYPAVLVMLLGVVCIVFFGIGAVMAIKALINKKPALIINTAGLTINPGQLGMAIIKWNDIMGFSDYKIGRQKFVMVQLNDNDKYINQETSNFKRRTMQFNVKSYGSPFSLSATLYTINHDELLALLQKSLIASQHVI